MAELLTNLQRYAEAAAVMREIAPAAPSAEDERACLTAAEACDRMAELAAAREVVQEARALDDERLDLADVLARLAERVATYDEAVSHQPSQPA
jgi:hypothetical protein